MTYLKIDILLVYKNTLYFIFENRFVFLDFKNKSYYLIKFFIIIIYYEN